MCPTILEILSNVKSDRRLCDRDKSTCCVCIYNPRREQLARASPSSPQSHGDGIFPLCAVWGCVEGVVARLAERLVQGRVPISCGCGCGTMWVFPPPSVGIWGGLRGSGR